MVVIISKVDVHWAHAFEGYIPSKHIFASGGVYTCKCVLTSGLCSLYLQLHPLAVGILGATVMPHSLFLGSALATQDRISFRSKKNASNLAKLDKESEESLPVKPAKKQSIFYRFYEDRKEAFLGAFHKPPPGIYASATRHSEHENNSFEFIKAHLYHGTFDMVGSLLGFAVMINSL
jgi:metal iron transporter